MNTVDLQERSPRAPSRVSSDRGGSLIVTGATLIDAVADRPIEGRAVLIEGRRIKAIARLEELGDRRANAALIDALGKYVIPGFLNGNVHLLMDVRPEILARYSGRYDELIAESAQLALRSGLTTVFDTWGPRRDLMKVRDRIRRNEIPGSRIFCAGNIIGLDGPFSQDFDFFSKGTGAVSVSMARRVNAMWVENVGRHLMWLTPEQVAQEVRAYIGKGIDFIKYASNDHVPGGFLAFSPPAQNLMVEEAHRAGITAQAHTMSVEGLRIAVEAGCDLIQHANITGPVPIPQKTLEEMIRRDTGAVIFPQTQRRLEWLMKNEAYAAYRGPTEWQVSDDNVRSLIQSGVRLLFANDGAIVAREALSSPLVASGWKEEAEGNLFDLTTGHFYWLKAMEEKGCPAMAMLKAATINVASAYGVEEDLGSIEPGKLADLLILDKNPLESAQHYRTIQTIIKDGALVDRSSLPVTPLLTQPQEEPVEEEASYVTYLSSASYPGCPSCMRR